MTVLSPIREISNPTAFMMEPKKNTPKKQKPPTVNKVINPFLLKSIGSFFLSSNIFSHSSTLEGSFRFLEISKIVFCLFIESKYN